MTKEEEAREELNAELRLQRIAKAREDLLVAQGALTTAILQHCPNHAPVQHRDGKPPWCPHCQLTSQGAVVDKVGGR